MPHPKSHLLESWLARRDSLSAFTTVELNALNQKLGAFLSIDVVVPAHEASALNTKSLERSWEETNAYVKAALSIINANEPLWLDREEVAMIRDELGDPPSQCSPIYLITVGTGPVERVVYIGKTSSEKSRFLGGHSALSKLLNPVYDGLHKQIYLGSVFLVTDEKSLLPLEWIQPLASSEMILKSVEAQLIYEFKPELNTHNVEVDNAGWPILVHIQNYDGGNPFLHDIFCHPTR
jgi:hypothetical protein